MCAALAPATVRGDDQCIAMPIQIRSPGHLPRFVFSGQTKLIKAWRGFKIRAIRTGGVGGVAGEYRRGKLLALAQASYFGPVHQPHDDTGTAGHRLLVQCDDVSIPRAVVLTHLWYPALFCVGLVISRHKTIAYRVAGLG